MVEATYNGAMTRAKAIKLSANIFKGLERKKRRKSVVNEICDEPPAKRMKQENANSFDEKKNVYKYR